MTFWRQRKERSEIRNSESTSPRRTFLSPDELSVTPSRQLEIFYRNVEDLNNVVGFGLVSSKPLNPTVDT